MTRGTKITIGLISAAAVVGVVYLFTRKKKTAVYVPKSSSPAQGIWENDLQVNKKELAKIIANAKANPKWQGSILRVKVLDDFFSFLQNKWGHFVGPYWQQQPQITSLDFKTFDQILGSEYNNPTQNADKSVFDVVAGTLETAASFVPIPGVSQAVESAVNIFQGGNQTPSGLFEVAYRSITG